MEILNSLPNKTKIWSIGAMAESYRQNTERVFNGEMVSSDGVLRHLMQLQWGYEQN